MTEKNAAIKSLDPQSIHRITSGQVVIDLQTAVKELVENSLDAGATSIEVRFKEYGLKNIQVIDNGSGIAADDYPHIALKHHTSKLSTFNDLSTLLTFGFRGEALSSLCVLSDDLSIITSTANQGGLGDRIEVDSAGKVTSVAKIARQRGTTITLSNLFKPLPVRRKEFERNAKREFGKALGILNAYALVPCVAGSKAAEDQERRGVRLTVSNQTDDGRKTTHISAPSSTSLRSSVSSLWGPKAVEHLVDLDIRFSFSLERRIRSATEEGGGLGLVDATVKGLISKFDPGFGRTGTDRQFFYVNGRPCGGSKIQKVFNEVYRSFNANQAPFIIADLLIPTNVYDVNVSPDKRTIFLHGEGNLLAALKSALEDSFAHSRSTYDVEPMNSQDQSRQTMSQSAKKSKKPSAILEHTVDAEDEEHDTPEGSQQSGSMNSDMRRSPQLSRSQVSGNLATSNDSGPSKMVPDNERSDSEVVDEEIESRIDVSSFAYTSPISATRSLSPKSSSIRTRATPTRYVQTVLDTSGAIWNQTRSNNSLREPPRKKRRSDLSNRDDDAEGNTADVGREGQDEEMQDEETQANGPDVGSKSPLLRIQDKRSDLGESTCAEGPGVEGNLDLVNNDGDQLEETVSTATALTGGNVRRIHTKKKKPTGVFQGEADIMEIDDVAVAADGDQLKETTSTLTALAVEDVRRIREKKKKPAGIPQDETDIIEIDELEDNVVVVTDGDQLEETMSTATAQAVGDAQKIHSKKKRPPGIPQDEADIMEIDEIEDDVVVVTNIDRNPTSTRITTGEDQPTPEVIDITEPELDDPCTPKSDAVISTYEEFVSRAEVVRSTSGTDRSFHLDLSRVSEIWRQLGEQQAVCAPECSREGLATDQDKVSSVPLAFSADDDDKATAALSRVIDKKDFGIMDIVGQFNRGFIITRRRKCLETDERGKMMDDLFIIDQHAADEKYNFETLQQTTKINSQKLLRPQPLELTAGDELLAADNLESLKKNGFDVEIIHDQDSETAAHRHNRLQLVAQPVSKGTVFDMKDLEELIQLLRDCQRGQTVRCSKARAMFAMRACRKSVMVGMPLNKQQMTSVVRHMGTMDQPWNCPHGRPTMRHLSDITAMRNQDAGSRAVDWRSFGRHI